MSENKHCMKKAVLVYNPAIFDLTVSILGICYGFREIAYGISSDNAIAGRYREYGYAVLNTQTFNGHVDRLFRGLEDSMRI